MTPILRGDDLIDRLENRQPEAVRNLAGAPVHVIKHLRQNHTTYADRKPDQERQNHDVLGSGGNRYAAAPCGRPFREPHQPTPINRVDRRIDRCHGGLQVMVPPPGGAKPIDDRRELVLLLEDIPLDLAQLLGDQFVGFQTDIDVSNLRLQGRDRDERSGAMDLPLLGRRPSLRSGDRDRRTGGRAARGLIPVQVPLLFELDLKPLAGRHQLDDLRVQEGHSPRRPETLYLDVDPSDLIHNPDGIGTEVRSLAGFGRPVRPTLSYHRLRLECGQQLSLGVPIRLVRLPSKEQFPPLILLLRQLCIDRPGIRRVHERILQAESRLLSSSTEQSRLGFGHLAGKIIPLPDQILTYPRLRTADVGPPHLLDKSATDVRVRPGVGNLHLVNIFTRRIRPDADPTAQGTSKRGAASNGVLGQVPVRVALVAFQKAEVLNHVGHVFDRLQVLDHRAAEILEGSGPVRERKAHGYRIGTALKPRGSRICPR